MAQQEEVVAEDDGSPTPRSENGTLIEAHLRHERDRRFSFCLLSLVLTFAPPIIYAILKFYVFTLIVSNPFFVIALSLITIIGVIIFIASLDRSMISLGLSLPKSAFIILFMLAPPYCLPCS